MAVYPAEETSSNTLSIGCAQGPSANGEPHGDVRCKLLVELLIVFSAGFADRWGKGRVAAG